MSSDSPIPPSIQVSVPSRRSPALRPPSRRRHQPCEEVSMSRSRLFPPSVSQYGPVRDRIIFRTRRHVLHPSRSSIPVMGRTSVMRSAC